MSHEDNIFKGFLVLVGITIVFIVLMLLTNDYQRVRTPIINDYSSGWLTDDGKNANLNDLTGINEIHKKINIKEDTEFYFSVRNTVVSVLIDNRLITNQHVSNEFLYGKTRGTSTVHVDLKREDSGHDLVIKLKSPTSKTPKIIDMYTGDGIDIMKNTISGKILPYGISTAIIIVGLILFFSYFQLRKKNLAGKEILYLSLFSYNLGVFLFADNRITGVLFGLEASTHAIAEIWLMLLVVPLMLYVEKTYNVKNKILLHIASYASIVFGIISFILNFLSIKDLSETVFLTHISFGLAILAFLYTAIYHFKNNKGKKLSHSLAILSISLGCVIDIIILYTSNNFSTSFYTELGILLFLIFECSDIIQLQLETYKESTKMEMLSHLAYHDGLTNLYNRTSYLEEVDRIEQEKNNALICMFDVNNLKTVNDTIGHQAGDRLIVYAAESIKHAFGDLGKVYRIGGDEFVAIINENPTKKTYEDAIEVMLKDIDEINRTKKEKFILSIAYGCEIYKAKGKDSLDSVIKKADKNMYKKKEEIKKKTKK